ncbi:hypothetical protein RFI_01628 [Reticulomyxa filosa]|uniref:Uncharacterized protein n=1 Tax=Reticulomyxa filosa TaxID=46433 RepID=X6PBK6_RETFI|nr:hypothetical protein RFI_01628 [Reticulomyxa filosa]|eukprot:ETO35434.1 hypothetical protein RFI_01628 [Reticulomyxa filosa]
MFSMDIKKILRHKDPVFSVKYGSNELLNTILSGSHDKSVRLWDIRSGQQIQVFSGHKDTVYAVEYSPFVVNNIEVGGCSNVICSASEDNTIRFWDSRSNKNELYIIKENDEENGIFCLKFIQLKNNKKNNNNCCSGVNLCYGLNSGLIHVWGYKLTKIKVIDLSKVEINHKHIYIKNIF